MLQLLARVLLVLGCVGAHAAAQPEPAFTFDSVLDTYFDDESGLISFTAYDLAFAPDEPLNASVVVTDAKGTVIKSFPFFPDYRWRDGVFGRAQVKGPADVTLTEPGIYNIVFMVDGEMATRLAVVLEQTDAGDDPFDPVKKFRFYGLWQVYAFLTMREWDDETYPHLTLWVGGRDLPEGKDRGMFFVTLKRDGEVVGHSKRTLGHIAPGHYKDTGIDIYRPHEKGKEVNTPLVPLDEWTQDGDYELVVTRQSDGAVIRTYRYTAKDGEIVPLAKAELGFEPRIDYMVPRVMKKGSNTYGFVEAIWVSAETKPAKP